MQKEFKKNMMDPIDDFANDMYQTALRAEISLWCNDAQQTGCIPWEWIDEVKYWEYDRCKALRDRMSPRTLPSFGHAFLYLRQVLDQRIQWLCNRELIPHILKTELRHERLQLRHDLNILYPLLVQSLGVNQFLCQGCWRIVIAYLL